MENSQLIFIEKYKLGLKLIESAITVDEALTDLLRLEVKKMKKHLNNNSSLSLEELSKSNILIKNILLSLTMNEEKIKSGLELLKEIEKNI